MFALMLTCYTTCTVAVIIVKGLGVHCGLTDAGFLRLTLIWKFTKRIVVGRDVDKFVGTLPQ